MKLKGIRGRLYCKLSLVDTKRAVIIQNTEKVQAFSVTLDWLVFFTQTDLDESFVLQFQLVSRTHLFSVQSSN